MSDSNTTDNVGVAAVDRAFAIVDALAQQKDPISLAQLARITGFYKSTLLRLIASLEKVSLVTRDSDGQYLLGPYAYELGRAYQGADQIERVLTPILEGLVEQGSESASFHVKYNSKHRLCLLRFDSDHPTLDSIDAGDLLPLTQGAAGRVIELFHNTDLAPTQENISVVSVGERDASCAAVACAVFGAAGKFVGALSLSGPKQRFTPEAIEKLLEMARQAAHKATIQLGGTWYE